MKSPSWSNHLFNFSIRVVFDDEVATRNARKLNVNGWRITRRSVRIATCSLSGYRCGILLTREMRKESFAGNCWSQLSGLRRAGSGMGQFGF